MCAMTHLYVCQDSFIRVPWLIYDENWFPMMLSARRYQNFMDFLGLIFGGETWFHVCHDSFIRVPWPIHLCSMTPVICAHDSFICVHDLFIRLPWLIHNENWFLMLLWSRICQKFVSCVPKESISKRFWNGWCELMKIDSRENSMKIDSKWSQLRIDSKCELMRSLSLFDLFDENWFEVIEENRFELIEENWSKRTDENSLVKIDCDIYIYCQRCFGHTDIRNSCRCLFSW